MIFTGFLIGGNYLSASVCVVAERSYSTVFMIYCKARPQKSNVNYSIKKFKSELLSFVIDFSKYLFFLNLISVIKGRRDCRLESAAYRDRCFFEYSVYILVKSACSEFICREVICRDKEIELYFITAVDITCACHSSWNTV